MALTAVERVTRWQKKHREEYNDMQKIVYNKITIRKFYESIEVITGIRKVNGFEIFYSIFK